MELAIPGTPPPMQEAGWSGWVIPLHSVAVPRRKSLTTRACPAPAAFLKGLSDKQREEHYFCKDFIKLKKIPTWKETAKGIPCSPGMDAPPHPCRMTWEDLPEASRSTN